MRESKDFLLKSINIDINIINVDNLGEVAKRFKAADCKSVG